MLRLTLLCSLILLSWTATAVVFSTNDFYMEVNEAAEVVALTSTAGNMNYAAPDQPSSLLQVLRGDTFQPPDRADWDAGKEQLRLQFGKARLLLQVAQKDSHITFELIALEGDDSVARIQWGPIATRIQETVGEVIGVVRDDAFALGMLGLNPKTLGGPLDSEEGRDPSRSRAAMPTAWGSTLQAYSIDRSRPRTADVWGGHFTAMPIPPIPGETLIGSKVAFFGCPAENALARIGTIELAEDLPHPIFEGKWSRENPNLGRSYLIASFTEETVDEMIGYAKRGNFLSLYHSHPFKSWGHYTLREDHFPNGEAGMKACVDKATAAGLLMGGHTLTNFINTNDPYVTPVPDPRLAKTGSSVLTTDINARSTSIEVASPEFFNNTKANWLRTVMIGEELIRYGSVSDTAPWTLLDCRRGAWGTKASKHKQGAAVGKLMDHPYKVFLTNYDMQHDVAKRLATLFNATGMNHFDLDGHEGCLSSGQGDFALEMFAKTFYDHMDHFVHNGTSNSQPYYWHINTCCNWGEPWYGGFRSSMAEYRINNQVMLERNFMPKMLGWFQFTPDTTLADIEWLMARSAGYNSGFALSTDLGPLRQNPDTGILLDTLREWEKLRMANAFSEAQREAMRDVDNEFHLHKTGENEFELAMYEKSETFAYEHYVRQPGEPTFAEWRYTQQGESQPLQFLLEVQGEAGEIDNISFEFDNYIRFDLPFLMKSGYTLLCDGSTTLRIYDEKGRQVKERKLSTPVPTIPTGAHTVIFSCDFEGTPSPVVHVQFKALATPEKIRLP